MAGRATIPTACCCSPGPTASPIPTETARFGSTRTLAVDEVRRRADRFFGERGSGYALWAREHGDGELEAMARSAGLHELERIPELVLDQLPAYVPPPDGVELRRASDRETREDYLAVVADAWGMADMPRDVAARVFFDPDSLAESNVAAYVAYFDETPLSAAMTHVTHGVALGCQAATIRRPKTGKRLPPSAPPGERRGLAESCLWEALERSFEQLGAELSLCQTSNLGAPVWLGLGYEPFTSYARYLVPLRR